PMASACRTSSLVTGIRPGRLPVQAQSSTSTAQRAAMLRVGTPDNEQRRFCGDTWASRMNASASRGANNRCDRRGAAKSSHRPEAVCASGRAGPDLTLCARLLRRIQAFCRDTDGVILPYVTILLVVIMGVGVLALDGARYMSLQTQLQQGADA